MDLSDIAMLKKLDEIEAKEYSDKEGSPGLIRKNSIKSNYDDFDGITDDDDLADLLYDDDVPKVKPKSPKKDFKVSEPVAKASVLSGSVTVKNAGPESGDMSTEVDKSRKRSSGLKKPAKSKIDLFLEDEEKYLGDLGLDELENISAMSKFSNEQSQSSPIKPRLTSKKSIDVEFDDDNAILDSLDASVRKDTSPAKGKRQSFMDDLLGKNTTKSPVRKITSRFDHSLESSLKDDNDDIMVRGGYVPSASSARPTTSIHRQSTIDDQFMSPVRAKTSPVKERRGKTAMTEEVVQSSRRPRADLKSAAVDNFKKFDSSMSPEKKKKEDMWPDFLNKESEFKTSPQKRVTDNTSAPSGKSTDSARNRKDSGADWLGFSSAEPVLGPINKETSQSKVGQNESVGGRRKEQYPWLSNSSPPVSRRKIDAPPDKTIPLPPPKNVADESPLHASVPSSNVPHSTPINSVSVSKVASPVHSKKAVAIDPPVPQSLIDSYQLEKDQLLKTIESMTLKKEQDLKNFEEAMKKQQKTLEESYQVRIKAFQDEHAIDLKKVKAELVTIESDRRQLSEEYQERLRKLDSVHEKEIQRLKEFHSEAVILLKQGHEDAISRMKRLRDQELEAMATTQSQSKSLQQLSDQLEARTAELAALQKKVDDKHQTAVREKEEMLLAREKELKGLEGRLRWQMEEGDQERSRLQQLVLRLEKRLEQQTKDGEEDRWKVQQLKAKLEVQQNFLAEEKKLATEGIEREKEKLRLSQVSFLQEQKTILIQLAQERQQVSSDRHQQDALAKRVRDEEARFNARKLSEESNTESLRRQLEQENEKLYFDKELSKQETLKLRTEREALERDRRQLKDEKDRLDETRMELKRKMENLEEMTMKIQSEREESRTAISTARKIESDHHARMNQFTEKMQDCMEREKTLLLEREKIAEEKREFQKTKDSIMCINCKMSVGLPFMARPPTVGQNLQENMTLNTFQASTTIDPNLMVWYITAEKDREYLQEQLMFLKSMKDCKRK